MVDLGKEIAESGFVGGGVVAVIFQVGIDTVLSLRARGSLEIGGASTAERRSSF